MVGNSDTEHTETYPMIQVPNPRAGEEKDDIMYVYQPWTADDVRKATEGIPHPRVNVRGFEDGVRSLCNSYRLNGIEM